ncbi:MAG: o-succinylbenzoate synthase, partial [candidate division Zixibacteria bacterium]|nr:o-succinylbenzoate synthase [candidate division Zixibacteria bacterium]
SGGFEHWLSKYDLSPSSRCGVETATLQLMAAERGVPMNRIISDSPRDSVTVNGLLSNSRESIPERATALSRKGFTAFKLKVGRESIAKEIDLTREVRQTVGNDAVLRLDANRAWGIDNAIRFSDAVKDCSIDYIEEPVRDIRLLKGLLDKSNSLPIALDESLLEIEPADLPVLAGIKAVVLKPMMLGFERAVLFARVAMDEGITPVISSSFESGTGLTALAHLALSLGTGDIPAGLDTLDWFAEDLLSVSFPIRRGRIKADELPDISRTIKLDYLINANDD